ncbi:MAG: hypothetical protein K0R57_3017 [Paenibacillaceae bacterium]|nr:hypothetical protein [Paenibacillaceae bacterium]
MKTGSECMAILQWAAVAVITAASIIFMWHMWKKYSK